MRSSAAVICVLLVASALATQPRGLSSHSSKTVTKTTTTKKAAAPSTAAPSTAAPSASTAAPSTAAPSASTAAPAPSTAAPSTAAPSASTAKPSASTAKPSASTAKPSASTAKPSAGTVKGTTTTTTAKKAAVKMIKKVKVSFTFAALDFTKLKVETKTAMTKAVTDSVVEGLGAGYTKDHVSVELKAGSVIAVVSITPKEGATAAALSTSMDSTARGAIEKTMATKVKAVPAIKDAVADGKTLDDIAAVSAAPAIFEVAAPTTKAPATTQALQSTGASAPIAAVSMMSMVLAASQIFA